MAQAMRRDPLVDAGGGRRQVHGAVELARGHVVGGVQAREQPTTVADLALGVAKPPPCAQPLQQHGAEHGVAVLAALALLHAQGHALTVDVADLERDHLADAQARAVGHRHGGLVLEVGCSGDQAADFLGAQDHGQLARHGHVRHLEHELRPAQRDVEEELQPGDGGVDGDRAGAGVHQVQLEATQVLGGGGVRRAAEEGGELAHGADVALLRVLGELAHAHVVEHALAQRRDGRRWGRGGDVHDPAPVGDRGGLPHIAESRAQRTATNVAGAPTARAV